MRGTEDDASNALAAAKYAARRRKSNHGQTHHGQASGRQLACTDRTSFGQCDDRLTSPPHPIKHLSPRRAFRSLAHLLGNAPRTVDIGFKATARLHCFSEKNWAF